TLLHFPPLRRASSSARSLAPHLLWFGLQIAQRLFHFFTLQRLARLIGWMVVRDRDRRWSGRRSWSACVLSFGGRSGLVLIGTRAWLRRRLRGRVGRSLSAELDGDVLSPLDDDRSG